MRRHSSIYAGLTLLASVAGTVASSFVVTAIDVAPPAILANQRRELLKLAVNNPAAGGAATVRLSSFGVSLEKASGAGLSTLEASGILASMEIYLDANGNGAFEPDTDTFVTALYGPDLTAGGGLSLDLAASEPADVQVAAGATRNYFVVGHLNSDSAAASPNAFRIVHIGSGTGASSAVDAATGTALTLVPASNVTSKLVSATPNQAPTTTGIADVIAFDNAMQGIIPLYPAFHDGEDASSQLAYTLTGNTNPSLFSFVGIEAATGRVLLTYLPGVTGASQLTVQATDTLGKSVTASFQVKVIPFVTYSDFQVVHPNAGGPLERNLGNGQTNLLSYAFFLNQGPNGGTLGLPRLQGVGNARIFSHLRPKLASDVFYNYQISADMQTWIPAVKNVDYYESTKDMGDGSVRVELLLLNGWQRAFMRVQTQLVGSPAPPPEPPGDAGAGSAPNSPPAAMPPPPSPGVPILSSTVYPSQTVLSTAQALASGMLVKDMDNDGFRDILVASFSNNKIAWFHNNHDGTFGGEQVITTQADGAFAVSAGDLDNDGLIDALSGSFNDGKVAWYKRNANGTFGAQQVLVSAAGYPSSVSIADLDRDGKQDVVFTSWIGNTISWCRNLSGGIFAPAQPVVSQTVAPWTALIADLDGDGILDIATASINNHSVEWYKGNGNGTFGGKMLLTPFEDPEAVSAVSLSSGDVDGDGYVDLVGCFTFTQKIVWFKNDHNAGFLPRQYVTTQVQDVNSVKISDLDGDGKLDVVASSLTDNRISWYRNLGGGNFGNPDSNQLVISNSAMGAFDVGVGDFDQDGKMDVASSSQDDSKVAVYLNRGGQTALLTTDIAPAVILDGERRAVLRIDVCNRGVTGNDNARLDSVSLLLESGAGVPLTTGQANALIDNLMICADSNDSGNYEPGTDLPVAIVPYLSLNAGKLTVSVRGNALPVQIAPGTSRSFFVVPQLTADAASQTPNAFRMTHFTGGPVHSNARDAFSGALLSIEASPVSSVVSSISSAQINSSPTTTGLPNITVRDTVAVSSIQLRSYFNDLEEGATGLRYEITANTNASLFSFVGINAGGKLVIRYRPGISGGASITVQATDSLGKAVSSTFAVSVSLANTLGNWSGGTGAGLLRYAFGLTPLGGDVAGLPRMKLQGKARVVTHQKPMWATDLNYQYEISQDMQTWIPAIPGVHYHEFSKDLPNALRQSDCVLLVNWPKAYLRVRTTLAGGN